MEVMMKADHPWVLLWMEVRRQRDLGITDDDVRLMMRKGVAETYEDDDRSDAEEYEDDDRKKKAKADDDQDDADEAEDRDRMNDMYVMRGYSIRRFRDVVVDVAAEAGGQVDVDDL